MKKLISIILLCAMLVSTLASCGMEKGLLDLDLYPQDEASVDPSSYTSQPEWDGSSSDTSWYTSDKSASTFYLADGADLKGFIDLVYSQNVNFAGKTVKLKNGIHLGGKAWTIPSSSNYFQGTFDGDGHSIGSFTMKCTIGNQSLLGSIGGDAVVKNLKVEAGKLTLNASASTTGAAGVIARIVTVKGKTVTVENVSSACTISFTSNTKEYSMVGGVIGRIEGAGAVTVKGCTNSGSLSGKSCKIFGGVIGCVTGNVTALTISNCNNTSSVSAYDCLGGILGAASACTGGIKISITDCTNTGSILVYDSSSSGMAAGIVGRMESTGGSLSVTGCKNTGMVSYTGSKTGGAWLGGILGYIHSTGSSSQIDSVTVSNCQSTGAITANRTSGGLIGFLQRINNITVENCSVNATLTFNIQHSSNYYVGGLIGIINANNTNNHAVIKNCTVSGTMLVNEPMESAIFAGGLLGSLRKTVADVSDCSIELAFAKTSCEADDTINVTLGCLEDSNSALNPTNLAYKFYNSNAVAEEYLSIKSDNTIFKALGFQSRYNASTDTYDLRFVFGIDNLQAADTVVGFNFALKNLGENSVKVSNVKTTLATIYTDLSSSAKDYAPSEFSSDYFATYTLSGIPASEVKIEKRDGADVLVLKNQLISIIPFTMKGVDGKAKNGDGIADYTLAIQKVHQFEIQDFWTYLPSAFSGATGILTAKNISYNPASNLDCQDFKKVGSYDQYILKKTCKCTGGSCTCEWGATGVTAYKKNENVPYHYYIDLANYKKSSYYGEELERYAAYHSWTFEVAEDGYYDFCFRIRLNGTEGSEQERYALVQFDGESYIDQTEFFYSVETYDETMRDNAENHDTYLTGYGKYLTAGKHTITFRIPYDANGKNKDNSFHIRDIYMVKSALPVDKAEIPVPTGATLYDGNFDTTTCTYALDNTTKAVFDNYRNELTKAGFTLKNERVTDYQYSSFDTSNYNRNKGTMHNYFYLYTNADYMVYTYFCEGDGGLRVVVSELSEYEKYAKVLEENKTYNTVTTPLFAMIDIGGVDVTGSDGKVTAGANFGMCLIYRLSDGRFVIVDGGNWVSSDKEGKAVERLYDWLAAHADYDGDGNYKNNKITIAAWLITHHHSDHISVSWKFNQMYQNKNNVVVENYLYNFPDYEYAISVPGSNISPDYYLEWFPKMESMMKNPANNNLVVHSGFKYQFADLSIDILSTHEDMFPNSIKSYNNSSTVYKITFAGKTFLVAGDLEEPGQIQAIKMAGTLLESDFLQVTHHGGNGQIEFYKYIVGLDASGNFNKDTIVIWPLPQGEVASQFTGDGTAKVANRWLKEMFYKNNDKNNDNVYFAIENWEYTDF